MAASLLDGPRRRALPWVALAALTAVRLVVASTTPLAPDEAYYWVWSRALQAGYLDHPPMVALWIRAGTALWGESTLGVRLLAPLAAAAGSVLLADAARRLVPGVARVGLMAAVLLNATLMVGAGSVTMTPDTPLLFFAVLVLWAMVRAGERAGQRGGAWWLAVGAAVGLATASKYTGVLLGAAVPLWLLSTRRFRVLGSAWLWGGGLLALLLFAPVIWWNWANGWVSFIKQGGRTGIWQASRAAQFLSELVGGQLALASPPIFVAFAAGIARAVRRAWHGDAAAAMLATLAVPGLLIFVVHAVGDRVQGNWLALLYPPLAIAAAVWCGRRWRAMAAFGFAVTAVVYLQAAAAPFALPRGLDPTLIRLAGWRALAIQADALRARLGLAFIASEDYGQASELAWLAPVGSEVVGAETRWTLFDLERPDAGEGLLLISTRRTEGPDPTVWAESAPIDPAAIGDGTTGGLVRARDGVEAERFLVYRVRPRRDAAAAILPRPGRPRSGGE